MAESRIKDTNYYQVSGWMINRLGLKGTALQVFAIIHGFSQDGESSFTGSLQYLMDFTNTSKHTVIKALKELTDKAYIIKTENVINGVHFNTYKVNAQVVQKLHWGSAETALGGSAKTALGGSAKTAPNNKSPDNKSSDNKGDNKGTPTADYSETTFSEAMKAKVDEWLQYKSERKEDYQPTGLKSLITQIQNNVNQYGEAVIMDLIGECMANGYRGIIFDRLKNKKPVSGRKEPVPGWVDKGRDADAQLGKDMQWLKQFCEEHKEDNKTMGNDPDLAARAAKLQEDLAKW